MPFLIASFTSLFAGAPISPRPSFTRLTVEEGLSNNSVLCLLQDQTGVFWIGTNGGLNRYDGTSFIQYNLLSHPGLINNTITALLQDRNSKIWIGTDEGLEILDPETNTLQPFRHSDKNVASLPPGPIKGLRQMKDGGIWIFSDSWLAKYTGNGGFQKIALDPLLMGPDKVFTAVAEDRENRVWLSYLDQVTVLAKLFHPTNVRDSLGSQGFSWGSNANVYVDPNGVEWGVSPYGVDRYDGRTNTSTRWIKNAHATNTPRLHLHTCYTTDADGNIWQAARMVSLAKYDLAGRQVDDLGWLLAAAEAKLVYCLYKDDNNTIWIGTDNGIIKLSGRHSFFRNLPFIIHRIEQKEIRCRRIIEGAKGRLYAGTESHGFLQLTPSASGGYMTEQLSMFGAKPISSMPMKNNCITVPSGRYDIGYVYDIWDQGDSVLWFAGYGIGRYDSRKSTIQLCLAEGDEAIRRESRTLYSISFDGARFWLGGQFDIFIFDPNTRQLRPFSDNKNTRPFHGVSTWCIKRLGDWIWAGTNNGLYKINILTRQVEKASPLPAMGYAINDICVNQDGTFWLSTAGGGLVYYDAATGKARQYTTMDGLSNNTVCGVLRDSSGNLWISTYAGLNCMDRQSAQFTAFYAKDGLGMDEFNRKAFTMLRDGRLIFGGLNGYILFDPQAVFKTYRPVNIRLCRAAITGSDGRDSEMVFGADRLKRMVIRPSDKLFSISFALTDLYDPRADRYFYKLEGVDNDWHFIGGQHTLSFMSLPAGQFMLHIKGAAAKGLATNNELTLPIEVLQVFYKRPWFLASLFLGFSIVIYGFVRYRINQWKKLEYLRTKIASDLHDEIGSNLVRITLLADSSNSKNSTSSSRETLDVIANISRNAVNTIKDVVWSIDARYDSMVGMIDYMHEHIHNMLEPADIDFSFRHVGLPMEDRLNMNFRQNVYLIYKESINNIVKHADATYVDVELQSREGVFLMSIRDNGRGILKEGDRGGHGMGNMQMRASRIKGNLKILSRYDGVTVRLEAPFKQKIGAQRKSSYS
jgi:ligand-binding sensor domain-containing protein/two-component sensor histidine kinase